MNRKKLVQKIVELIEIIYDGGVVKFEIDDV